MCSYGFLLFILSQVSSVIVCHAFSHDTLSGTFTIQFITSLLKLALLQLIYCLIREAGWFLLLWRFCEMVISFFSWSGLIYYQSISPSSTKIILGETLVCKEKGEWWERNLSGDPVGKFRSQNYLHFIRFGWIQLLPYPSLILL